MSSKHCHFSMKDTSGNSALHCACWCGCADIARLLLDHGAITDYQNLVRINEALNCKTLDIIMYIELQVCSANFSA